MIKNLKLHMGKKPIQEQIKQLRLDLRRQIVTAKDGKVEVVINGDLKILAISVPDKIKSATTKSLKISINKAILKAQKRALASVKKITG